MNVVNKDTLNMQSYYNSQLIHREENLENAIEPIVEVRKADKSADELLQDNKNSQKDNALRDFENRNFTYDKSARAVLDEQLEVMKKIKSIDIWV